VLVGLGWRRRGENGVAGRRYLTRDDPATGAREAHLHVHAAGAPVIAWHLAFRDRLRAEPAAAAAYLREKQRCAGLHPGDSGAYAACKKAVTDGMGWQGRRSGGGLDPDRPPLGEGRAAPERYPSDMRGRGH
jgi:GrpB-like predicted nucleotidyltransferase (UPF0157 family)